MYQGHMNRYQRMQLKTLICVLGLILIMIVLIGHLMIFIHKEPQQEPHIPVMEELENIWIIEADSDNLLVFQNGEEKTYPYSIQTKVTDASNSDAKQSASDMENLTPEQIREQIADLVVTDGVVTELKIKNEKINGRILSADATGVELEGYGRIPLKENYKGYRIYKSLAMCTVSDLCFGYNFADFVIEDGKICGILIAKEEAMEYIRVLIKGADFAGTVHQQLEITADTNFTIQYGSYDNRITENYAAGEVISIELNSSYFQGERVLIRPDVLTGKVMLQNVTRSQGVPSYRGCLELHHTEDGIVVVNEVLLEEYLYCVVPSEMPASYPDEALKAQAVCARTYAYGHMQHAGYPQYGAHLDDSTSFQVYNNILEQASTTKAVKDTYGQLLYTAEGNLADTYYYSTSCGVGTDATIWKTEEAKTLGYMRGKALNHQTMEESDGEISDLGEYLKDESAFAEYIANTNPDDFEALEGWYRWRYEVQDINTERMLGLLQQRYQNNSRLVLTLKNGEYVSAPIKELDTIKNMQIILRGSGGVADELVIETKKNTYKVISEHNIRYVLNNGESMVVRQDGSEVVANTLLPSAFFVLDIHKEKEQVKGYTLLGGGFGHGVGMSQNGARNMAKAGYTSDQIITFFFEGCFIKNVYENGKV